MNTNSLIKKYNVAGPRYTSYPTALLLQPVTDSDVWREALKQQPPKQRDISVYVHLPFCRSLCWYCGCNKVISRTTADSARYLSYLEADFRQAAALLGPNHRVTQLHLGGGTPTFLTTEQLMKLSLLIQEYFNVAPDAECSVEMDPRYLTYSQIQVLRGVGFNRASIGVQDMDPEVQKAIHRIQPFEQNKQVTDWLREAGFHSINMDLIYGLPAQTPAKFADTVDKVLSLRPERLAVYNYAHIPDLFPAQRLIPDELLPTPDEKLAMLQFTIEHLQAEGYEYIGMDHFALPTDELAKARKNGTLQRNFQGYSTRAGTDTWAFGTSAISQIGGIMTQRHKDLDAYYAALDRGEMPVSKAYTLSDDDNLRRDVIMKLMCGLTLRWDDLDVDFGLNSRQYFATEREQLTELASDGLLVHDNFEIRITEKGRLFLRNIAMVFDAWLPKQSPTKSFSRTV